VHPVTEIAQFVTAEPQLRWWKKLFFSISTFPLAGSFSNRPSETSGYRSTRDRQHKSIYTL